MVRSGAPTGRKSPIKDREGPINGRDSLTEDREGLSGLGPGLSGSGLARPRMGKASADQGDFKVRAIRNACPLAVAQAGRVDSGYRRLYER